MKLHQAVIRVKLIDHRHQLQPKMCHPRMQFLKTRFAFLVGFIWRRCRLITNVIGG